jgi:hypothetical protein
MGLRNDINPLTGTSEPLDDSLGPEGFACPGNAKQEEAFSSQHRFLRFDFAQLSPDPRGLRSLRIPLWKPGVRNHAVPLFGGSTSEGEFVRWVRGHWASVVQPSHQLCGFVPIPEQVQLANSESR